MCTIPNSVNLLRTHILFKKILDTPTYIWCFIKHVIQQTTKYERKSSCSHHSLFNLFKKIQITRFHTIHSICGEVQKFVSNSFPKESFLTLQMIDTGMKFKTAAATAWLAPFAPQTISNVVPNIVSSKSGVQGLCTMTSWFVDSTTTICFCRASIIIIMLFSKF